ncbi:MAG: peptidoglycan recognition family protein [Lachnospiraceae bacterium]
MLTYEERKRRERYIAKKRRRKHKRNIQLMKRLVLIAVIIGLVVLVFHGLKDKTPSKDNQSNDTIQDLEKGFQQKVINQTPDYQVKLLTPNEYSRPQIALEKVKGIVIHYTANPGTTAIQNRGYFESLKDTRQTKASSHFVVGIEGEIVQCIPSGEIAYASNDRNQDTLSIECCHQDESGQFTQETYDSLVELTAWLCGKFNVPVENVIRHYDVTGKECPLYYVEHEDAWKQLKQDIQNYLDTKGVKPDKNSVKIQ